MILCGGGNRIRTDDPPLAKRMPVINGDAHTHGSDDPNFDWKNPSSTDRENLVTPKGVLFRPDGKVIEYDKNEANDHEIDK